MSLAWGCSLQTRAAKRSRGLLGSTAWEEAENFGKALAGEWPSEANGPHLSSSS